MNVMIGFDARTQFDAQPKLLHSQRHTKLNLLLLCQMRDIDSTRRRNALALNMQTNYYAYLRVQDLGRVQSKGSLSAM